jgi:hypothetical protein
MCTHEIPHKVRVYNALIGLCGMPRQHRFLNLPGETQKNQEGLKLNGLQLVVLLCTHDVNLLCVYVCMYVCIHA